MIVGFIPIDRLTSLLEASQLQGEEGPPILT